MNTGGRWWRLSSAGAPPPDRSLLHFAAGDEAAVGFGGGASVRAQLHPLHHQVQQAGHGMVHVNTCHCTRLKVGDAEEVRQRSLSGSGGGSLPQSSLK